MTDDALADFELEPFSSQGKEHQVYRSGAGPAVIVMAEIPGITPKEAQFARTGREEGFTVVLQHLFGAPGRDPDPSAPGKTGAETGRSTCRARVWPQR